MKKSIFKQGEKYTFKDYFDLPHPIDDIVAELGYSYTLGVIDLPQSATYNLDSIVALKQNYYQVLPKISLRSEVAKREFLIAPILFEVAKGTQAKINMEYPIEVDDKLGGYLDYLIQAKQNLIVIEAKKRDIDRGFNQLAAALVALDKQEEGNQKILYGAITIGKMWVFSTLNRQTKQIQKDLHHFTIPEDVENIVQILVGIIEAET
jgi:hypothetical protein